MVQLESYLLNTVLYLGIVIIPKLSGISVLRGNFCLIFYRAMLRSIGKSAVMTYMSSVRPSVRNDQVP